MLKKNDLIDYFYKGIKDKNSLKIGVHERLCDKLNKCIVNKIDSKIEEELKISILKKAAQFKKEDSIKKKK